MSSKYKHEINIKFNSNDEELVQRILDIFLDSLDKNNIELKALRTKTNTSNADLNSKGNELLDDLNIKVNDVSSIKDILNSKNFSATLNRIKKE